MAQSPAKRKRIASKIKKVRGEGKSIDKAVAIAFSEERTRDKTKRKGNTFT